MNYFSPNERRIKGRRYRKADNYPGKKFNTIHSRCSRSPVIDAGRRISTGLENKRKIHEHFIKFRNGTTKLCQPLRSSQSSSTLLFESGLSAKYQYFYPGIFDFWKRRYLKCKKQKTSNTALTSKCFVRCYATNFANFSMAAEQIGRPIKKKGTMLAIDEAIVRADVTIYRRAFCGIARISENQSVSMVLRNVAKFLAL